MPFSLSSACLLSAMNPSIALVFLCVLALFVESFPVSDSEKAESMLHNRIKRWGYGYGGGFYPGGGGYYPGGGGFYPGGGGFYPGGGGYYPGGGFGGFGNRWGTSIGLSANLRLGGFNNGFLFG